MKKKLTLNRDTLAHLDADAAAKVEGGQKLTVNGCVSHVRSHCGCVTWNAETCYC